MEGVLLVLVMYCGTPVSVTVNMPDGQGKYRVSVGPTEVGQKQFWLDQAKLVESGGGEVHYIKVEEVLSLVCPVRT